MPQPREQVQMAVAAPAGLEQDTGRPSPQVPSGALEAARHSPPWFRQKLWQSNAPITSMMQSVGL